MLNPLVLGYDLKIDKKPNKKLVQDAGRALLFYGLKRLGINPGEEILLSPKGKPYFSGDPVHFNISHSMDKVVAAIFTSPVGIDIEVIRENKEKIAKRFFKKEEWEYLLQFSPEEFSREFTGIWTKKESYIKMTGEGLSCPLDSFNVLNEETGRYFREINIFKGYKCHICAKIPVKEEIEIVERLEELHD